MTNKISAIDKTAENPLAHTTEGAILSAVDKAGIWKEDILGRLPLLLEIPFDSGRRKMSTLRIVKAWKRQVAIIEVVKRIKKNSPVLFAYYFVRKERM